MLLIATFIYACIIMRNFGRGLKEQSALFMFASMNGFSLIGSFLSIEEAGDGIWYIETWRLSIHVCPSKPDEH